MASIRCSLAVGMLAIWPVASVQAKSEAKMVTKFEFPGSFERRSSPSGTNTLTLRKTDGNAAKSNVRELLLQDKTGKVRATYEFDRRVDGKWSHKGDTLFINDYQGSDTFDCVLPLERDGHESFVSLTEILMSNKDSGPVGASGIKPPETPENSHYYLTCSKWLNESAVSVELRGVTLAGGEFLYKFRFDLLTRRFELSTTDR